MKGQIGLEADLDQYVEQMVFVFREVRRVLRPDGTLWLNLGDSYPPVGNLTPHRGDRENRCQSALGFDRSHLKNELKPKNTLGVPWRIALALQADGWILRQDIIWAKANPMPESVKDRCTKSHEYIFLFVKSEHYYFDTIAAMEPAMGRPSGNNVRKNSSERGCPRLGGVAGNVPWAGGEMRKRRSVWTIPVGKGVGSHHAAFPPALAQPCVQMGCPLGGIVLDPFLGTGTTLSVANRLGRSGVGIELNPKYVELAGLRLKEDWIRQFGLVGT